MKFDVLTLFPEMFVPVKSSIIGRAEKNNLIELNLINFREFSTDKQKHVDDCPYGGGAGMVLKPEPIYDAYMSITKDLEYKPKVIYLSPQGNVFNQDMAKELSKEKHLIFLCGHYEGVDQRLLDEIVDEEISIGDYVLTGGELPAMVVIDAVSRNVEGVLNNESLAAWVFILPAIVGTLIFIIIPVFCSFYLSFTEWDLLGPIKFVGLRNYIELFKEPLFYKILLSLCECNKHFQATHL